MAPNLTKIARYLDDELDPGDQPRAAELCIVRPSRKQTLKNIGVSGGASVAATAAASMVAAGTGVMARRGPAPLVAVVTDGWLLVTRKDEIKNKKRSLDRLLLAGALETVRAQHVKKGVMNYVELFDAGSGHHVVTLGFGVRGAAAQRLAAVLPSAAAHSP